MRKRAHSAPEAFTACEKKRRLQEPQQTATTPAHAVSNTVELLTLILRGLDFKTLLLAQRVNLTFCKTIKENPDLQKKLFKLPVESFGEARELNMVNRGDVVFSDGDEKEENSVIGVFNTKALFRRTRCNFLPHNVELLPNESPDIDQLRKIYRKDASWKDMYISQPPMFNKDITIFAAPTWRPPFSPERVPSRAPVGFYTYGGDKLGVMHRQAQRATQLKYIGLNPANFAHAWPPECVCVDVISGPVKGRRVDCSQDEWFTKAITYN